MRLTRIAATNFEGYAELDLDLSAVSSVAITGRNGHGKSGLLDVVTYALGGRGRFKSAREGGSPDQQIRHGADSMWTCVEFDAPSGEHVRVERSKTAGKTASVHLWVDDAERSTQWTNAETDAAIARLIGLPLDTLLAGPIMAQEQASALMRAQSGDRLRMFVKLFEAEWCAPLHEDAKARRDAAEAERVIATGRIAELQALIDGEPQIIEQLESARQEQAALMERQSLGHDQLTDLKIKLAEVRLRAERRGQIDKQVAATRASLQRNANEWSRVQSIVDRAEAVIAEPEPILPDIEAPDDSAMADVTRELEDAREQTILAARLQAEATGALREVERARQQREILATVPCGGQGEFATCRFLTGVPSEHAVAEMERAVAIGMSKAGEARDIGGKVATLDRLVRDHEEMHRKYERVKAQAAALMESARTQRSAAIASRDEHTATLAGLKDTIVAQRAELDQLVAEQATIDDEMANVAAVQSEVQQVEGALLEVKARLRAMEPLIAGLAGQQGVVAKARDDIAEWRTKEASARSNAAVYTDLAKAFHITGIPTLLVENGIAIIEERANEVLARLPQDFRIELRTQREKKGGGLMDSLDVIVVTEGWETDYNMLSVGQRFRVDLALRLGLSSVLTHRHGARIDTLWLDEPLADLDDEGREAAVEALSMLASDFDLIVVVSHHADFNDRFPARIQVEQDAGISTATLVA